MKTSEMNQKYLQIIKDYDERTYHEICAFKQRLKEDADYFDTFPVEFLLIPKFFNKEIIAHFERIANTTYQILQKVTQKYLGDDNYRKLFRFDPLLESMILSDCRYEALIPIARIDLFYNEDTGTFKFCEWRKKRTLLTDFPKHTHSINSPRIWMWGGTSCLTALLTAL